ncbi:hypothetical protein PR048_009387 [Dryococelus australis]|uniref:Uncharacterized protein n=1 Tax=Dryococelus australis TaxID=614101 RepID=A0ABQ9I037_9NEOP|nr:hypothetical protein PR048_009387 [Dryococelus australis]
MFTQFCFCAHLYYTCTRATHACYQNRRLGESRTVSGQRNPWLVPTPGPISDQGKEGAATTHPAQLVPATLETVGDLFLALRRHWGRTTPGVAAATYHNQRSRVLRRRSRLSRSEIGCKVDTVNCCTIRVQSWTGDPDEVHWRFDIYPISAAIKRLHTIATVMESGVSAQLRRVVPGGDVQSLASFAEVRRPQAVHGIIKQHEWSGEKSPSTMKSRMSSLPPMRSQGEKSRQPMREQVVSNRSHAVLKYPQAVLERIQLPVAGTAEPDKLRKYFIKMFSLRTGKLAECPWHYIAPSFRKVLFGLSKILEIYVAEAIQIVCDWKEYLKRNPVIPIKPHMIESSGAGKEKIHKASERVNWLDRSPPNYASQVSILGIAPPPPGFYYVGIVPNDAAGRRVFSGISRFPQPFHFGTTPSSPRFALIASKYTGVTGTMSLRVQCQEARERYGRQLHSRLVPHRSYVQGAFSTAVEITHDPLARDGPLMLVVEGISIGACLPPEQILQCRRLALFPLCVSSHSEQRFLRRNHSSMRTASRRIASRRIPAHTPDAQQLRLFHSPLTCTHSTRDVMFAEDESVERPLYHGHTRHETRSTNETAHELLLGGGRLLPTTLMLLYYAMHGLRTPDFSRGRQRLHSSPSALTHSRLHSSDFTPSRPFTPRTPRPPGSRNLPSSSALDFALHTRPKCSYQDFWPLDRCSIYRVEGRRTSPRSFAQHRVAPSVLTSRIFLRRLCICRHLQPRGGGCCDVSQEQSGATGCPPGGVEERRGGQSSRSAGQRVMGTRGWCELPRGLIGLAERIGTVLIKRGGYSYHARDCGFRAHQDTYKPAAWTKRQCDFRHLHTCIGSFVCMIHDTSHYDTTRRTAGTALEVVTQVLKFIVGTNTCINPPLHGQPDALMNHWKISDCFATRHKTVMEGVYIVHWGCIHNEIPLPSKRGEKSHVRNNPTQFFGMIPHAPFTKEGLLDLLMMLFPTSYYCIALERHAEGFPHLHFWVETTLRISIKEMVGGLRSHIHSDSLNLQIVRNKKETLRYITKENLAALHNFWEYERRPAIKRERFDEPEIIGVSSESSDSTMSITDMFEVSAASVFANHSQGPSPISPHSGSGGHYDGPSDCWSECADRALDWIRDSDFEDWPSSKLSGITRIVKKQISEQDDGTLFCLSIVNDLKNISEDTKTDAKPTVLLTRPASSSLHCQLLYSALLAPEIIHVFLDTECTKHMHMKGRP